MFKIIWQYKDSKKEEIDSFDTIEEANRMLTEYRMAFGVGYLLWIES